MKRIFAFAVLVVALAAVASCGSSKGGHCDAYTSANQTHNADLASK